MEAKSKSRNRDDFSGVATPTRSVRLRLNEKGDRLDRHGFEGNGDFEGNFMDNGMSVKDLRVHRIFSHVPGKAGLAINGKSESVQATLPLVSETKNVTPKGFGQQLARRRTPSPGCKTLKPCFRTKLFGNPGSFSYRRLLPYLMDITKGAFKSIDMKPQPPKNVGNSVVGSYFSTFESDIGCGARSSSQHHAPSPHKILEQSICTENTADTNVPLNSSLRDQEVLAVIGVSDLSNGQVEGSVNKNDKFSESVLFKETEVLGSTAVFGDGNCVDFAIQGKLNCSMDGLDNVLCSSMGYDDVHAVSKDDVMHDKSPSITCDNGGDVLSDERNSDQDQCNVSASNTGISSEATSGTSYSDSVTQHSVDETRSEQTIVLDVSNLVKHLKDAHVEEKNVVNNEDPESAMCSQDAAELVQNMPVSNGDFGRKDVAANVKPILKDEIHLDDVVLKNKETPIFQQFIGSADDKQSPSSLRKPCPKLRWLKRFHNYNSVSYRKLLPYLTDIYEDSAGFSNKGQTKIAKVPLKGDFTKKNSSTTIGGTTLPSDYGSCDVEPELTNSEWFSVIDAENDSHTKSNLENGLKSPTVLRSHVESQPIQYPSPSSSPTSIFAGECVAKSQCTASNSKEEKMPRSEHHSDDLCHSNIKSVCSETISSDGKPCPSKGILKKNPRGCRGLCTCLKCASFRLHAEKAFEFSRNQLLDSEEITLELINELSLLRNMLKRFTNPDGGETSQVQEAFKRADIIEKHAKARFEQMNHDLRIHCQIPNLERPTISFARHFEEVIPTGCHRS